MTDHSTLRESPAARQSIIGLLAPEGRRGPAEIAVHGLGVLIRRYWGVILLVLVWFGYVVLFDVHVLVIPSPVSVIEELATNTGRYIEPTLSTLTVAAIGIVGGTLMGAVLAALSWFARTLSGIFTPIAVVIRSVPIVAMIPVLARVFGYEQRTIMVITIAISFFPTFVFVSSGLRATPPGSADVFAALGAGRMTIFRRLALPSAVPNGLIAFRLSAADCVLAALIAEFLMGTQGLGHVFQDTVGDLDMLTAWSAAIVATILSVTFFAFAKRVERSGNERWSI
jgi:NitT/TauT family transport system permease protein